jgi:epoxyqueuosine reductase QueG
MTKTISIDAFRAEVERYVAAYPEQTGDPAIWRTPLVASARADARFDILPQIAADDHSLPQDLLPAAKSVVVFFIPFHKALAKENHKGDIPCRNWGLAYQSTNQLIGRLCGHLKHFLEENGHPTEMTPATHNFDEKRLVSRWSHKHLGHIVGLGRFGVNAQFITPAGCTGRMGSLVTAADLGDHPLVTEEELCLHKRGEKCLVCVRRCPVEAISVAGIDRQRCWARLKQNIHETEALAGLDSHTHVCGKCQVLVPCSLGVPSLKAVEV